MPTIATALFLCLLLRTVQATIPAPGDPPPWLELWTFNETNNWTTANGYTALGSTNIAVCELGDCWSAVIDYTNGPAWLHYNVVEADGTNLLRVDKGSLLFWFAPNWTGTNSGGTGPGEWSRLIEVGAYTTNASYGWWSLYLDPEGANIYFSAQTNGSGCNYLSAPINWDTTNRWHLIALTYSATNSSLWIDAQLVTNGLPVTLWPGPDVLTNGFFIGSDSTGFSQAHGMFDDFATYDYEIDGGLVGSVYWFQSISYYANPLNLANFASAPSQPVLTPSFNAITGPGNLVFLSNVVNCVSASNVWLTNFFVAAVTNGALNVVFTIAGGSDNVDYDVFANSILDFSTNRAAAWAWMGQGYHCKAYMIPDLTSSGAFLILGTPLDRDQDGLTDA